MARREDDAVGELLHLAARKVVLPLSFCCLRTVVMLTAMILICSLTDTPDITYCTRANAVHVLWVPEMFSNPATCFMHGQAYVAGTTVGRELTTHERIKVICLHKQAAGQGDAAVVIGNGPALR